MLQRQQKSLNELSNDFDQWMKNTSGHSVNYAKELLGWLYMTSGAECICDYKHFCALAKEIASKGYQINTTISEKDFDKSMKEAWNRKIEDKPLSRSYR